MISRQGHRFDSSPAPNMRCGSLASFSAPVLSSLELHEHMPDTRFLRPGKFPVAAMRSNQKDFQAARKHTGWVPSQV